MKIQILYDNASVSKEFKSGWGFSCLVDGRILFDTGEAPESLFFNMDQFQVQLQDIEAVVISHNHWDHTGGLWELLKKRPGLPVYACPGFGEIFEKKVIDLKGKPIKSATFQEITTQIGVTGEVPGQYKCKFMPEQALVVKTERGLSVITGCSHPGIVNMVLNVSDVFQNEFIFVVMGGFHLMDKKTSEIQSIMDCLKESGVQYVAPTHCTGQKAKKMFQKTWMDHHIPVAAGFELEL